jgi:small subunit ribosomal protein S1
MDPKWPDVKERTEAPETMEQLLDDYDYQPPKRGEFLQGEIIHVDDDSILIDVGAKRDAIVPRNDLSRLAEDDLANLEEGEVMPVRVLRSPSISGDLLVSLSKGLAKEDWERAEAMLEGGQEEEFEVVGRNRGGVLVRFGYLEGFVPNSHLPDARSRGDMEALKRVKRESVGEKMLLKVLEVDRKRNRLILSGRAAEKARRKNRLEELEAGQKIKGRVVNLTDFGAFVALGGIDGLIHRSELSWDDIGDPGEVLDIGDEIEVMVKDVDVDRERVSLSRKDLLPSPWDDITQHYSEGDLVEGIVSNVVHFGAFVTLPDGIEGLIHSSEMDIIGPGTPTDVVKSDDPVLVRILSIEPDRHRMALSLKQVSYDEQMEWMEKRRSRAETDEEAGSAIAEELAVDEISKPEAAAESGSEIEAEADDPVSEAQPEAAMEIERSEVMGDVPED